MIGHNFTVGFSTVSAIVSEICDALGRNLQTTNLPEPTTEIWKKSKARFYKPSLNPIPIELSSNSLTTKVVLEILPSSTEFEFKLAFYNRA